MTKNTMFAILGFAFFGMLAFDSTKVVRVECPNCHTVFSTRGHNAADTTIVPATFTATPEKP